MYLHPSFLVLSCLCFFLFSEILIGKEIDIQSKVDRLSTSGEKVKFLENLASPSNENRESRLDALNFISRSKNAEFIGVLLENVTFPRDVNIAERPAIRGLIYIGEPAIPKILEFIGASSGYEQFCAVQTIMLIKGEKLDAFLKEHEKSFSPEVKRGLARNLMSL